MVFGNKISKQNDKSLLVPFLSGMKEFYCGTYKIIANSGIDFLEYNKRFNRYRLKLNEPAIEEQADTLIDLLKRAYELRK